MDELYKKHRPDQFNKVLGQDETVKMLLTFVKQKKVPHAILFSGPSGCGKTTLARIMKEKMGCIDSDFVEMNAADTRGIDEIRKIRQRMSLRPIGKCRIYLIDECHKLTNDAQTALLKMLEDTPGHVYFFLCTTERERLIKTILTRCTDAVVKGLGTQAMRELIERTAEEEDKKLEDEVVDAIAEKVEGSARKALVLLEQVLTKDDTEEQLAAVERFEGQAEAIQLARVLVNPRSKYNEAAAVLRDLKEDPESVRRMILGYCASILLKGGKLASRAFHVIDCLRDNVFDTGRAGLAAGVWEIYNGR